MKKTNVGLFLIILGTISQGAMGKSRMEDSHFQTDENGYAKAPAEFSGFTVTATTHCDSTATSANQSIRALTAQIEQILKSFADPSIEEGIQSFPGATTPGDLVKYQNGQPVTLCKGWRATHSYFFKLANISAIPAFQDAILELNKPNDLKKEIGLSAPRPGIFSKTYELLVDQALKNAHKKALRRVKVLLEDMPEFTTTKLVRVASTVNEAGSVAYDQTGLGGEPSLSALSSVSVSITRSFQFELLP